MGQHMQLVWVCIVLLVLLFLCFRYTGQWSLANRLVIAWSRLNALVVVLMFVLVVGPLLFRSLPPARSLVSWWSSSWSISSVAVSGRPVSRPVVVSGQPGTSVLGGPSLSASFVDAVLSRYGSPAAGNGWALYSLSVRYGVDDAVALAFFWHESNFGVNGEAAVTHSLGNLRCIADADCIDQDRGGYAAFPDWPSGFAAWFRLIVGPLYVGSGRSTVETIIPRYAPTADHNNERAYIDNVCSVVAQLRAGHVQLS